MKKSHKHLLFATAGAAGIAICGAMMEGESVEAAILNFNFQDRIGPAGSFTLDTSVAPIGEGDNLRFPSNVSNLYFNYRSSFITSPPDSIYLKNTSSDTDGEIYRLAFATNFLSSASGVNIPQGNVSFGFDFDSSVLEPSGLLSSNPDSYLENFREGEIVFFRGFREPIVSLSVSSVSPAPVPEPTSTPSCMLAAMGLGLLLLRQKVARKRTA